MSILEWIKLDWIGLDWIGLDWIGLDWIGLDWIRLDWIGLDWIGLDWIGLDWIEYCIGLDWTMIEPVMPAVSGDTHVWESFRKSRRLWDASSARRAFEKQWCVM